MIFSEKINSSTEGKISVSKRKIYPENIYFLGLRVDHFGGVIFLFGLSLSAFPKRFSSL